MYDEWHSDFANVFFTVKWNGPRVLFKYTVHWKHSIQSYRRSEKKNFLCPLKYMLFFLLYKMPFLRNWVKLYFNLMELFDWNDTFVLSYYISYYSIDCEMTADDSQNRWRMKQCHIPEELIRHSYRCEILKTCKSMKCSCLITAVGGTYGSFMISLRNLNRNIWINFLQVLL